MSSELRFKCRHCDQTHVGIPDLGFDAPYHYAQLNESEQADAELTSDLCTIEDDHFIRGVLQIPIIDHEPEYFGLGVWVSLSAQNFARYQELFDCPDPDEPPYFGWFCNRISGYPDTLNLKAKVILQPHPNRPKIELQPTDHPLSVQHHNGISVDDMMELLHAHGAFDSCDE
ncbi:MAG TPA: DUF2199 domain-containing protein [Phycisphaerae bacterium]|nr:DUF2199 domain-containing protein [Phycisphaerae bacterium]